MEDGTFNEDQVFPGGLPSLEDILEKKRKTFSEKLLFETIKNPVSSPTGGVDITAGASIAQQLANLKGSTASQIGTRKNYSQL
jgi:hypothetical protein